MSVLHGYGCGSVSYDCCDLWLCNASRHSSNCVHRSLGEPEVAPDGQGDRRLRE